MSKEQKKLDGKIVRFIAIDRKYMTTLYPAIAPESKRMGTFATGQHVDPEIESTLDNLTKEEMTGKTKLSAQRKNKWPYIIDPAITVHIEHMKRVLLIPIYSHTH